MMRTELPRSGPNDFFSCVLLINSLGWCFNLNFGLSGHAQDGPLVLFFWRKNRFRHWAGQMDAGGGGGLVIVPRTGLG